MERELEFELRELKQAITQMALAFDKMCGAAAAHSLVIKLLAEAIRDKSFNEEWGKKFDS